MSIAKLTPMLIFVLFIQTFSLHNNHYQTPSLTQSPFIHLTRQKQIKKNISFQLKPFLGQYIIKLSINHKQQFFGINCLDQQPSWIFIKQSQQPNYHKACFYQEQQQQSKVLDVSVDQEQNYIQYGNDYVNILQQRQNSCLDIIPRECLNKCKKVNQLSSNQKPPNIQSTAIYQLSVQTENQQFQKLFLSVQRLNVKQFKNQYAKDFYQTKQRIVNFYVTIAGEINIGDFQYLVISHHKEKQSQYYINSLTDFKKFQNQQIILLPNKQGNNKNKIKTKLAGKQLQQASVQFVPRFNSTTSTLGLPHFIYDQLKKYVIETIFEKKCEQLISTIFLCPFNKNKQLQKQTLQFCLSDSNQCFVIMLFDLIQWQSENNIKKQYKYSFKVQNLQNNDTIIVYPQFASIYQILIKSGIIYGLAPTKQHIIKESQAFLKSRQKINIIA